MDLTGVHRPTKGLYAGYLMLVAVILLTAGAGLYQNLRLHATFSEAVQENQRWAARLAQYGELARESNAVTRAGSELFSARPRDAQVVAFTTAMDRFDEHLDRAREELQRDLAVGGEGAPGLRRLLALIGEISRMQEEMNAYTGRIFASFRFEQPRRAGEQAAAVYRLLGAVQDQLESLRSEVHRLQETNLLRQQARAAALGKEQRTGGLLLLLLVSGLTLHGHRLASSMRRAATERQHQHQLIATRNQDMRRVLDHVDQGLLTLDTDGAILPERSAILDRWLGPPAPGATFWEYLAVTDRPTADQFHLGWQALLEDHLPRELLLSQLPQRLIVGERTLALAHHPILGDGSLRQVLVVLRDITGDINRERSEGEQRDLIQAVDQLLSKRDAFLAFYRDAERIVGDLAASENLPLPEIQRLVHTLKGNASLFGLGDLCALCHEIEGRMEEAGALSPRDRDALVGRWQQLAVRFYRLLGDEGSRPIQISEAEYAGALRLLQDQAPYAEIIRLLRAWALQPTQPKLDQLADQVRDLARRLDKCPVRVTAEGNSLRIADSRWAPFFGTLTHVVRNAVDHGLERPDERLAAGKPEAAEVLLRTAIEDASFVIEIADDGRGIDWVRLAARARASGRLADTQAELSEALFADGISTRNEVSEHSGRGVGMAAVRSATLALGGEVQVESEPGQGTRFRFSFPAMLCEERESGAHNTDERIAPQATLRHSAAQKDQQVVLSPA